MPFEGSWSLHAQIAVGIVCSEHGLQWASTKAIKLLALYQKRHVEPANPDGDWKALLLYLSWNLISLLHIQQERVAKTFENDNLRTQF